MNIKHADRIAYYVTQYLRAEATGNSIWMALDWQILIKLLTAPEKQPDGRLKYKSETKAEKELLDILTVYRKLRGSPNE